MDQENLYKIVKQRKLIYKLNLVINILNYYLIINILNYDSFIAIAKNNLDRFTLVLHLESRPKFQTERFSSHKPVTKWWKFYAPLTLQALAYATKRHDFVLYSLY